MTRVHKLGAVVLALGLLACGQARAQPAEAPLDHIDPTGAPDA